MTTLKLPFDQGEIDLQLPYFFKIEQESNELPMTKDIYGVITGCTVETIQEDGIRVILEDRLYLAPTLPPMDCLRDFYEQHSPITKVQYVKVNQFAKKKCSTF